MLLLLSKMNEQILQQLINFSATLRDTALIEAASKGEYEKCIILLQEGANPNNMRKNDGTNHMASALMHAARNGDLKLINLLIKYGSSLNLQNQFGFTALMLAAYKGHIEACSILINRGANLDVQDNSGKTALFHATEEKHTAICGLLLEKSARSDLREIHLKETALTRAIWYGDLPTYRVLLDGGVNPNLPAAYDLTPLMLAATKGNIDIILDLLSKGANPNITDSHNETVLHKAARKENLDLAIFLTKVMSSESVLTVNASKKSALQVWGIQMDRGTASEGCPVSKDTEDKKKFSAYLSAMFPDVL